MRVRLIIFALAGVALLGALSSDLHAKKKPTRPSYKVVLPESVDLEVGFARDVELSIAPAEGYRVDHNGPLTIDLRASDPELVSIKRRSLRRRDAADAKSSAPRFHVPMVGKRAGQAALAIRYRFWLCRAKICIPIRGEASVPLVVTAPPAPPGPSRITTVPEPASSL